VNRRFSLSAVETGCRFCGICFLEDLEDAWPAFADLGLGGIFEDAVSYYATSDGWKHIPSHVSRA